MDIQQFKSRLGGGGARSNLYRVILPFPAFASVGGESEELSFLCRATSLPGSRIGEAQVPFLGRTIKLAGDRDFDNWNIVVINDTDFLIKNAFERWLDGVNGHFSNVGFVSPADYMVDGVVQQLDRQHNVVKSYKFEDIWPADVSGAELAYDNNNSIQEFSVTFAVNYWTSDTTT